MVGRLLDELYPEMEGAGAEGEGKPGEGEKEGDFGENEEAMRIADVLRRFGGNQEKAARELGISKAILWRRRKRYGIG